MSRQTVHTPFLIFLWRFFFIFGFGSVLLIWFLRFWFTFWFSSAVYGYVPKKTKAVLAVKFFSLDPMINSQLSKQGYAFGCVSLCVYMCMWQKFTFITSAQLLFEKILLSWCLILLDRGIYKPPKWFYRSSTWTVEMEQFLHVFLGQPWNIVLWYVTPHC